MLAGMSGNEDERPYSLDEHGFPDYETANLPAGTTIYGCPLEACEWTHAEPPPGTVMAEAPSPPAGNAATLDEAITESAFATVRDWLTGADRVAGAHLKTHSLIEWVQEVGRLQRDVTDAHRVVAILLRKLGGGTVISEEELVNEHGTLARSPDLCGFTLAVKDEA